jgi:hypothetical protein
MKVTKLVSVRSDGGECDDKTCPTLYRTDSGSLLVQGAVTAATGLDVPEGETVVEIPAELIRKAVRDQLI